MLLCKVHILFDFRDGPWGGGNQFLKALRRYWREQGCYEENPRNAGIVLMNSHHKLNDVLHLKRRNSQQVLVHRVDGPVEAVRGTDAKVDRLIYGFNRLAEGTVFQSEWSRIENKRRGMHFGDRPYFTVLNAPDSTIFHARPNIRELTPKIKLIATSWSTNLRKGFEIYEYLDNHLDFTKFDFTFVGNSPVGFRNVHNVSVVPSEELAKLLWEHDVFITASMNDPCSNSLIEALHCGLPAVVRNSGGHPEILGEGGELFESREDILIAIEKVARDPDGYASKIRLPRLEDVAGRYYQFMADLYRQGGEDLPLSRRKIRLGLTYGRYWLYRVWNWLDAKLRRAGR